jgi:hypothetical protein
MNSFRGFLNYIQATMPVDNDFVQPPERHGDVHIMEYAITCGHFDKDALHILNCCRLYLHVTTVSELFDATGQHMLPHMFNCTKPSYFNPDTIITLQRRPSEYQIRYRWKRLCREWSKSDGTIAESITLGPWLAPSNQLRLRRSTYFENSLRRAIYHWNDGTYWEYTRERPFYRPNKPTTWTPDSAAIPIEVIVLPDSTLQVHQSYERYLLPLAAPAMHYDFDDYVATLPTWERDILDGVDFLGSTPEELMHSLTVDFPDGVYLFHVSDGSVIGHNMAFGWVLGTGSGHLLALQKGPGFGTPTSHRAEGWGTLSGSRFLLHLHRYTRVPMPTNVFIVSISDNEGLIQRLNNRRAYTTVYANSTLVPDWDLTEQIHATFQELSLPNHTFQWVKGH